MAEVKNAFIKSKMNKDLDSRLIPSGEYRNALNAQVSKSEGADVGALESVLGNSSFIDFIALTGVSNIYSIGHLTDEVNSSIYVFLTDNSTGDYVISGVGSNHFIYRVNISNAQQPIATKLVEGAFLNFSRNNNIYGVNILEQLLFWTDNRNQPRKINVDSASNDATYYSTEDNVSVAKYNPYASIQLYQESVKSIGEYETTMKDVVSKTLPNGGFCSNTSALTNNAVIPIDVNAIKVNVYPNTPTTGMIVKTLSSNGDIVDLQLNGVDVQRTVSAYSAPNITLNLPIDLSTGTTLVLSPNPYYLNGYNGDPSFLEDKFIRFSYRFKFDDGEYSIMAPFTQPCFIPRQDGYFLNSEQNKGDQQQAFSSTVVDFMENKVNKIDLQVPLPSSASDLASSFHVSEIDILYRESDSIAVKVVETIKVDLSFTGSDEVYEYSYQSKKPYKTLPSDETTRVYDKVPVVALGQEVISNRIVYANYQDKHTPPSSINYNVNTSTKSVFELNNSSASVNGDVTASTTINIDGIVNGSAITSGRLVTGVGIPDSPETFVVSLTGSVLEVNQAVTVSNDTVISFKPKGYDINTTSIIEYPSSSLKTNRNYQVGWVLSDKFGRQSTVVLSNNKQGIQVGDQSFVGDTLYSPYIDEGTNTITWPGNSLKISLNDPIPGGVTGLYNGDVTDLNYNPTGWYSYKIVVKQTEQEYYNVYSAGAMKGLPFTYPAGPTILPIVEKNVSFISLINDNINKVPRDLSEVGPQDKSFRSSVELYGRVQNTSTSYSNTGNDQYYPGRVSFTTSTIEDLFDLFDTAEFLSNNGDVIPITDLNNPFGSFYRSESNPFIAQISTSQITANQFGVTNGITTDYQKIENLTIFETKPVESRLDIFWETSSSGLISDINDFIFNESSAGVAFDGFNAQGFSEAIPLDGDVSNSVFKLIDTFGADIPPADITSFVLKSVTNLNDINVNPDESGATPPPQGSTNYFTLYEPVLNSKQYNVKVTQEFIDNVYFSATSNNNVFVFLFESVVNGITTQYSETVSMSNIAPIMTADNQTPAPAEFTIIKQTGDVYLETMTAKNGAYSGAVNPNPNRWQDLTWSIVSGSEVRSNGTLVPGTFALDVSLPGSSPDILSTCVLRSVSPSNIQGDTYSVDVRVTDGGQESITTTVNVDFGVVPTQVLDIRANQPNFALITGIQIENQATGSQNGWYIYDEKWSVLSGYGSTVDIIRTGATGCNANGWHYGSTKALALAGYWACNDVTVNPTTVTYIDTTVTVPSTTFFEIT